VIEVLAHPEEEIDFPRLDQALSKQAMRQLARHIKRKRR
jgi:hypothetical protein